MFAGGVGDDTLCAAPYIGGCGRWLCLLGILEVLTVLGELEASQVP